MSTHRGVAITAIGSLKVLNLPTPEPGPDEVLIHVHYAALIPFDGYQLDKGYALSADDLPRVVGFASAGLVKAVGTNVKDLREGDRVAAFNMPASKNKAAQEYTVVPRFLVAKVPESVPLHIAASMPDNYITAMYTVFGGPGLTLPVPPSLVPASSIPDRPAVDLTAPVLVYGAGSSSGQYLLQALRLAGFGNILAVASAHHHEHLRSLGATRCFDYRSTDIVAQLRAAAASTAHGRIPIAVDPIATRRSLALLSEVLASPPAAAPPARLAVLLPYKDGETVSNDVGSAMHTAPPPWFDEVFGGKNIEVIPIATFKSGEDPFTRENVLPVILPRLLEKGDIRPNRVRLIDQGDLLERVNEGLDLLRNNRVSGEKVVVDIRV